MEEDEQAGPEPKEEAEEEEEPRRCGKHPSQLLTGICSSCLMERLSSVRDQPEAEIVEVDAPNAASADTGKLRKTLMLLFQLDDSTTSVAQEGNGPHPQAQEIGDRGGRRKSGSWLRSILPRRWRKSGGGSVKAPSPPPPSQAADPCPSGGAGGHVERRVSFRRSSDWRVGREPRKGSVVDPPRHSWDGAMVGKAFACSFACLEDPPDGAARRVRRSSSVEELVGEAPGGVAQTANGGRRHSADEGRRRVRGDAGEMAVPPGVGRRRSNRWSRVWDRSITSPLKEFVRKGEHVLERSLSESRREVRRGKNAEAAADIGGGGNGRSSNGHVSGRATQGAVRTSSQTDAPSFRADWLRNKDCKIGRSRSVHYTSPGNLDNGMLRFYLTPMRSTRTANRGRRRNTRLFGRGLFGFV